MQQERRRGTRTLLESRLVIQRLDEKDNLEIAIDIIDVSKSGIGFTSDKSLQIGAIYETFLRIWTKEVIHAFVEIVRIEKKDDFIEYGASFVGMPEMDVARIDTYHTVEQITKEMESGS